MASFLFITVPTFRRNLLIPPARRLIMVSVYVKVVGKKRMYQLCGKSGNRGPVQRANRNDFQEVLSCVSVVGNVLVDWCQLHRKRSQKVPPKRRSTHTWGINPKQYHQQTDSRRKTFKNCVMSNDYPNKKFFFFFDTLSHWSQFIFRLTDGADCSVTPERLSGRRKTRRLMDVSARKLTS
jgi:hypothetical protein